jgi:hypothetical protein
MFFEKICKELIQANEGYCDGNMSGKMWFWYSHRHFFKGKFYGEISSESWAIFYNDPLCSNMLLQLFGLIEIFWGIANEKMHEELFDFYLDIVQDQEKSRKLCFSIAAKENSRTGSETHQFICERTFLRFD